MLLVFLQEFTYQVTLHNRVLLDYFCPLVKSQAWLISKNGSLTWVLVSSNCISLM